MSRIERRFPDEYPVDMAELWTLGMAVSSRSGVQGGVINLVTESHVALDLEFCEGSKTRAPEPESHPQVHASVHLRMLKGMRARAATHTAWENNVSFKGYFRKFSPRAGTGNANVEQDHRKRYITRWRTSKEKNEGEPRRTSEDGSKR
ncbi:hypothetical protein Zmor_023516 [Zophobas morio]|uniref:Uncharacterized protein n=1 Tax=Zophobas morio TaxID=2755281 RepID=A0AA38M7G5_9CUCU|nr:hypothetical protein Zmor_023516 [Zophobas morio]